MYWKISIPKGGSLLKICLLKEFVRWPEATVKVEYETSICFIIEKGIIVPELLHCHPVYWIYTKKNIVRNAELARIPKITSKCNDNLNQTGKEVKASKIHRTGQRYYLFIYICYSCPLWDTQGNL